MMKTRHLLVPVDFSAPSTAALHYALGSGDPNHTQVDVLHVDLLHEHEHRMFTRDRLDAVVDGEVRRMGPQPVPPVKVIVKSAYAAAPEILDYADRTHVDAIVLGSQGRRGLGRFLLGSSTRTVVSGAACEVVTLRQDPAPPDPEATILVPIDFSPHARLALRRAREYAAEQGRGITLLHVIEEDIHPAFYGPTVQSVYDLDPEIEAHTHDRLQRFYEASDGPDVPVQTAAFAGRPAKGILRYAEAHQPALIVMATHGETDLADVLIGSVTERVVERALCPVLTIPAHPAHGSDGAPVAAALSLT